MDEVKFYQIRSMPVALRKAIKVAAALEEMTMTKWIVKTLTAAVKAAGVVMEDQDQC